RKSSARGSASPPAGGGATPPRRFRVRPVHPSWSVGSCYAVERPSRRRMTWCSLSSRVRHRRLRLALALNRSRGASLSRKGADKHLTATAQAAARRIVTDASVYSMLYHGLRSPRQTKGLRQ